MLLDYIYLLVKALQKIGKKKGIVFYFRYYLVAFVVFVVKEVHIFVLSPLNYVLLQFLLIEFDILVEIVIVVLVVLVKF